MAGAELLARRFSVQVWSTEFILIIASIHQRIDALRVMLGETDLDGDIKIAAQNGLESIRAVFSMAGFANPWSHSVKTFLTDANLNLIRMASLYVRTNHGYYALEKEELDDVVNDCVTLIDWLKSAELTENDFIRGALIDGLEGFVFKLNRVGYFGWPDSFESLKNVIAAYMALERGMPDANVSPPYEAAVKKTGEVLRKTFERIKLTKEVSEVGDWLLRGYVGLQAIGHVSPAIAGLLTHVS